MRENGKRRWSILSDRYSEDDQLSYSDYCEVLRTAAEQAETPISIGILGDWGSGKTSLMKMLQRDLSENPNCITIWFDAWKFTKEDVLWRAFLLRVIDDLRQALQARKKLNKKTADQFEQWERRIYEALDLERTGELTLDWRKAASAGTSLVSSVIPFGSILSGVVDKLTGAKATSEATEKLLKGDLHAVKDLVDLVHREKIEIHKRQLQFMEDFQNQFEAIIAASQEAGDGARLVVFVDDLDRCLPEKAVQILEAIKLFLEVKGTVFVLGVAPEVVQRGIEVWYQMEPRKGGQRTGGPERVFSGKKYLEKIIQLPFRLPVLEQHQFVEFIQKNCEGMPKFCDDIFGCGLEANPREAKRLLNIFGLQMALGEKRLGGDLHPPLLAKLNVIQERWTGLYQHLVRYPAEIKTLEQACTEQLEKAVTQEEQPLEGEEAGKTSPGRAYSEIIAQYAAYSSLQQMMCCKRDKCSVQQIPLSVLQRHIHLTETTVATQAKPTEDLANPTIWQQLTGESDEERNEALEKLKELPEAEKSKWSVRVGKELRAERPFKLAPVNLAGVFDACGIVKDPRDEVLDAGRMAFCHVPSGRFWLGEGKEAQECDLLNYDYWIAKYPATVAQYRQFAESPMHGKEIYWPGGAKPGGMPTLAADFAAENHPIVNVSWFEGLAFCRWLTVHWRDGQGGNDDVTGLVQEGWRFLLPSEIEWEKAARGSEDKRVYPWGDSSDPRRANYDETGISHTTVVGCFPGGQSPYGCLDMAGNVCEWCRNKYAAYPYQRDDRESVYEDTGSRRVVRGGSWLNSVQNCRNSYRRRIQPVRQDRNLGFRVALVPSSVVKGSKRSGLLQ